VFKVTIGYGNRENKVRYRTQQYQWTDNIAIQKEQYFWQPPSEPYENCFKARPDSLNAIDKRPYPLDLIISYVVGGRTRAQGSYLLVQSDGVIVEQQHNECNTDVIARLDGSENCRSFRVEWKITGC